MAEIDLNITCELKNCKFYNSGQCDDPIYWVENRTGLPSCRYEDDAILFEEWKERSELKNN